MKKQLIHRIPNQVESWVLHTGNTKLSRAGMMRHKRFINAIAVIAAGSLGLSVFILQPQVRSQETKQSCEIATLNAKKQIEQGRDITVITNIKDGSELVVKDICYRLRGNKSWPVAVLAPA